MISPTHVPYATEFCQHQSSLFKFLIRIGIARSPSENYWSDDCAVNKLSELDCTHHYVHHHGDPSEAQVFLNNFSNTVALIGMGSGNSKYKMLLQG